MKEREEEEKKQAILEQKAQDDFGRNPGDNQEEVEREMEQKYQEVLMATKFKLGMITEIEYNEYKDKMKQNR